MYARDAADAVSGMCTSVTLQSMFSGQSGTFGPKFTASTLGCPEVVKSSLTCSRLSFVKSATLMSIL